MHRLIAVLVLTAAFGDIAPAQAGGKPKDATKLIDLWISENASCRGRTDDDVKREPSCAARDAYTKRLHTLNWCYAKKGQYGYQDEWHKCTKNSIRNEEDS